MRLPRKTNVMYSALGGRVHYSRGNREDRGGRLSVYWGRDLDREIDGKLYAEYYWTKPLYLIGAGIQIKQDEDPLRLNVFVWPFSLYLRVDTRAAKWLARKLVKPTWDGEREIEVRAFPREQRTTVRWSLWHPSDSWSSKTPRWRDGHFDFADFLLGRRDMRWEPVETVSVSIPMPEGTYAATVEMRDHVSWRKRLPFWTRRLRCANVEIPKGIGKPGKGENAWDCGDDATFAVSCPAQTVEEAIGKVVASVMRDRKRYGGSYTFTPMEAA